MATLGDIEHIRVNLKKAATKPVQALHELIYGKKGDRGNRQRLRQFDGFKFTEDSAEFEEKVAWTKALSIGQLAGICQILSLDCEGLGEELARRVCRHLCDLQLLRDLVLDAEENSEDEDNAEVTVRPALREEDGVHASGSTAAQESQPYLREREASGVSLSFCEIEETIRSFDGSNGYPVEAWITEFEENASLLGWADLQKLMFAKKRLSGLAKLVVQGERGVVSWRQLKSLLLEEFSTKINSAQLHQMLSNRSMHRDESVQEYFLVMKEIAARGNIETDALIQYIVEGIPEEPIKKITLYEAKSLPELKEKLKVYDKIRRKFPQAMMRNASFNNSNSRSEPRNTRMETTKKAPIRTSMSGEGRSTFRCFNCNELFHAINQCPKLRRNRGSCYVCGSTEHQKAACPQRSEVTTADTSENP